MSPTLSPASAATATSPRALPSIVILVFASFAPALVVVVATTAAAAVIAATALCVTLGILAACVTSALARTTAHFGTNDLALS